MHVYRWILVKEFYLDGMDEGLGDEVAPVDVAEGAHLHSKENEYSLKPSESPTKLESREMVITRESDYPEGSFQALADILDATNVNRGANLVDACAQPCASPCYMDDVGNMVEELTVRNYDNTNFSIVGTSNSRERIQTWQSQWQHLYQLGGASGIGSSRTNTLYRDNGQGSGWEEVRYSSSPVLLGQKTSSTECNEIMEQPNAEHKEVSPNIISHGGIRTKILSKSGFSEFFVKNTLKGKGIIFRGPHHESPRFVPKDENNGKAAIGAVAASNSSLTLGAKTAMPSSSAMAGPRPACHDGVGLRHWLNARQHKVNKVERLHVFRQIVDLVDHYHSQGVTLPDLRPSSFKLLQSNQVIYVGFTVQRDVLESAMDRDIPSSENQVVRRRPAEQAILPFVGIFAKKQKFSESRNHIRQWPQFTAKYGIKTETASDGNLNVASAQYSLNELTEDNSNVEHGIQGKNSRPLSNAAQQQLASIGDGSEDKWYASPEELSEGICSISSNIYSLGVLLFEVQVAPKILLLLNSGRLT